MATNANINKKEDTQMQKETQQVAIIEVLESNFGEHIIAAFEASQFFKLKQMIVDCKEKMRDIQLAM